MKKLLFTLMACFIAFAANAAKVYFENTDNWETVYAHYWSGSNGTSWPGKDISSQTIQCTNGTTYYWVETGNNLKVIFDAGNNQPQTKDLDAIEGYVYSYEQNNNNNGNTYNIGTISGDKFTAAGEVEIEYIQIYIPATEWNYDVCNIYSWNPSIFGGWPGSSMEKATVDDTQYWTIKFDKNELSGANTICWKLNAGQGQAESTNVENAPLFIDGYVYTLNGKSYELGGEAPEEPEPTPGTETDALYVCGSGTIDGSNQLGWTATNPYVLKGNEGVYSFTISAGAKIKISSEKADWESGFNSNGFCFSGRDGNSSVLESDIDNPISLYWGYAEDIVFPSGGDIYYVTINLKGNVGSSESTMLVSGKITYPEKLYVLGTTTPGVTDWKPEDALELKGSNGIYQGEVVLHPSQDSEYAYFSFATKKGSWDEVNQGIRYVPASGEDEILTSSGHGMKVGDDKAWMIKTTGPSTVAMTVDIPQMKVTLEKVTGVTNIEVEGGEAVYFNLQGQKVANPDKGIFVKVQNGKAVKVVK